MYTFCVGLFPGALALFCLVSGLLNVRVIRTVHSGICSSSFSVLDNVYLVMFDPDPAEKSSINMTSREERIFPGLGLLELMALCCFVH